jgi:CSLREA domain-containing protein
MKTKLALLLVLALLTLGLNPRHANARAVIGVNTTADELNTDGDCSLREAIQAANTDVAVDACLAGGSMDMITLPPGTYILSIAGPNEDLNSSGDLDMTASITLSGHTAADTIIDANNLDRVLQVMSGANVILTNLTLRNGKVLDQTGHNHGGGIYNGGTLTLDHVIVSGNLASQSDATTKQPRGGGIYNNGTLILTHTLLQNNSASHTTAFTDAGQGGGLYNASGTNATITDTAISANSTANIRPMQQNGSGGGIYNDSATLSLERATIDHNIAGGSSPGSGTGGGIYNNNGTIILTNVTISGNQAPGGISYGGGLYNKGAASNPTLTNVTLYANTAGNMGGNIYNLFGATPIKVQNTIIAYPSAGLFYDNCAGGLESTPATRINDLGHNLEYPTPIATSRSCGLSVADPKLLDLALNAPGETQTHALQTGSAALDVAGACAGAPATDQRGVARPQGTSCDLGAYEKDAEPIFIKMFIPSIKR